MTTTDIGKIFPTIATVDEVEYITAPSTDDQGFRKNLFYNTNLVFGRLCMPVMPSTASDSADKTTS